MLLGKKKISNFVTHAQQVEHDNLREHSKDKNKVRTRNFEYS